jgi:hypothetical protein
VHGKRGIVLRVEETKNIRKFSQILFYLFSKKTIKKQGYTIYYELYEISAAKQQS